MYEELKKIINNAYAPYSNFKVAAIFTDSLGGIYKGVNVENKMAKGMCAESVALVNFYASGRKGVLKDIYLLSNSNSFITPCFLCRQYIYENFDLDGFLYSYNNKGEIKKYPLKSLMPEGFKLEDKDV